MKKLKNVLLALLSVACVGTMAVGFVGCGEEEDNSSSKKPIFSQSSNVVSSAENSTSSVEESSSNEELSFDPAKGEEGENASKGLEYTLTDEGNGYSVTGMGSCIDMAIVIPIRYHGLPVISIETAAFDSCSNLTSVVITDGITTIGNNAFRYCDNLKSAIISDTVTIIGNGAFLNCTSLTSVEIGDKVISIGDEAFLDCDSLTSVEISDSVTWIGDRAFSSCDSLMCVEIPDSVTRIGKDAFALCEYLTIYCESMNRLSGWAEDWLQPVVWDCNNNVIASDGYIYAFVDNHRYAIQDGKAFVLPQPKGVAEINIAASVTVGEKLYPVTKIGTEAFYYCRALSSVVIPNSITTIGKLAFVGCCNLTSLEIPDSVTTIENEALLDCDSLTLYCETINQPSGWGDNWMGDFTCPVVWNCNNNEVADDGYIYTVIDGLRYALKDGVAMVAEQPKNIKTAMIPNSIRYKDTDYQVTLIGYEAFYSCENLTSVLIPDSVTVIDYSAFHNCNSLTSIEIPDSVTSIGEWAFAECDSLAEVVLPEDITTISPCTFMECDSLANIKIPDSVTSIGGGAFYGCGNLMNVELPDGIISIGGDAFAYIFGDEHWENGVLYIGKYLIKAQESIVGEYSVKDGTLCVADKAFYNCNSLTSVIIPDSVVALGMSVFESCDNLEKVELDNNIISESAFEGCVNLSIVVIGNKVTMIDYKAFYYCSSLTSITFEGTVEEWNAIEKGDDWKYKVPATEVVCKDGSVALTARELPTA